MKITTPKIIRDMPLKDYAPEMGDLTLQVWVNPPRDLIRKFTLIMSTGDSAGLFVSNQPSSPTLDAAEQVAAWYAEILSQGEQPERHMSTEDLKALYEEDPSLWLFISTRVWQMFDAHREALQKKSAAP